MKKISLCGIAVLLGCAVLDMDAAYLPTIGPSPLRFQQSPRPVIAATMLLPLGVTAPVPSTNAPVESMAVIASTPEPLGPFLPEAVDREPFAPQTISTNSVSESETTISESPAKLDPTGVITPQMLVDFFKPFPGGTNANDSAASPGSFIPPLPSSAATYKSR
jgi:hypothetical protein